MPDTKILRLEPYEILLDQTVKLHNIDKQIKFDTKVLTDFTGYLRENESDIVRYEKLNEQLKTFLSEYDFCKGYSFGSMQSQLETLPKFKLALHSASVVLNKYKAFTNELLQYMLKFPHEGEDDLQVVMQHIEEAKQVDSLFAKAQESLNAIKGYANRNGKSRLFDRFAEITKALRETMVFADVDRYKKELISVTKQVEEVVSAFEKEGDELQRLRTQLLSSTPDMWKNDKESLRRKVSSILSGDYKKASFDLSNLNSEISSAKQTRAMDIRQMIQQNPWLENDKYSSRHNQLVASYLTHSEYLAGIEEMQEERNKAIRKGVGIAAAVGLELLLFSLPNFKTKLIAVVILIVGVIIIIKKRKRNND